MITQTITDMNMLEFIHRFGNDVQSFVNTYQELQNEEGTERFPMRASYIDWFDEFVLFMDGNIEE